jgi:hypothetical protein
MFVCTRCFPYPSNHGLRSHSLTTPRHLQVASIRKYVHLYRVRVLYSVAMHACDTVFLSRRPEHSRHSVSNLDPGIFIALFDVLSMYFLPYGNSQSRLHVIVSALHMYGYPTGKHQRKRYISVNELAVEKCPWIHLHAPPYVRMRLLGWGYRVRVAPVCVATPPN